MAALRNLDSRNDGQVFVSLDYDAELDRVSVRVVADGERFTLYPPRDRVLDWYRHPFAYASRAEVERLARRLPRAA